MKKKNCFNNFQSGWTIPVDLVIGPRHGISYINNQGLTVRVYLISKYALHINVYTNI